MNKFKPMDVAYADRLHRPQVLVAEVNPAHRYSFYTAIGLSGCDSSYPESALRTKDEWLAWVDRFSDDFTGRELREAKESVRAEFSEPECWAEFRKRFEETGDPWMK